MIRPRFSLRTLVILVTVLPCAYFMAWEATKRYGKAPDMSDNFVGFVTLEESPMPFVIRRGVDGDEITRTGLKTIYCSQYYLWLCGPTLKIPFETAP